ncbi:MAG TPA: hypothetical protein PKD09_20130 [Aggregatilinea sp.]|jgi:hypothetical protein|uniref:hypothetical protein n=1 Tax=Aggregatilinea sp. TaxID=2806333 RepID=UPI002CD3BBAB|nr:hypothetical protein [Aggregatilinea sp.]HML23976.1 hypothetical protein [Aggregatilinea sp.]
MIKLLLTWDIKPGQDQEYFEFMVREFAPGITRLGLTPTEAWFAVYGECPQILMEGITDDLETMRKLLASEDWTTLYDKLLKYVDNYEQKVVRGSPGFQL